MTSLANAGQYYKMDDIEIRTYMGQENPEEDSAGAKKSVITIMRDQTKWNTGYSNHNREYTILFGACCARFARGCESSQVRSV
jgi:hypothetical protein